MLILVSHHQQTTDGLLLAKAFSINTFFSLELHLQIWTNFSSLFVYAKNNTR